MSLPLDVLLAPDRLVDLTQPLDEKTVLWPGSTPFSARTLPDDGTYARDLTLPEHAGTHLDAPAHFVPGGRRIHELKLAELVRPLVMLDVRAHVADNSAATIGRAVIEQLEEQDGRIPAGAAVLVHTGWDVYVGVPERYLGPVDAPAFPGLSRDAAELLVERGAVGLGIDTLSTDQGASTDFPVHHTTLPAGLWQLEGLVGLDRVPTRGAWLVVAPLRLVDGSGSPARAFAVLPPEGEAP